MPVERDVRSRRIGRALTAIAATTCVILVAVTAPTSAQSPPVRGEDAPSGPSRHADPAATTGDGLLSRDCFEELENGIRPEIACVFPLRLSDTEQAELEAGSRGYVKNVACTLTIRIPRKEVEFAIAARDHIFQSPEQPVTCTVTTHKSNFDITATFAPRVVFKNDTAVEATPGLGNVEGVTRVLSWPVVQFVNRWPSIRTGLLQVVNAYRTHARKKPGRSAQP